MTIVGWGFVSVAPPVGAMREKEVIMMRFALGYSTTHTLDEIGQKFGVSRERIRQIEKEALGKIASSELGTTLKAFLES